MSESDSFEHEEQQGQTPTQTIIKIAKKERRNLSKIHSQPEINILVENPDVMADGGTTSTENKNEQDNKMVEESVSKSVSKELEAQEPAKEEKDQLRKEHKGHLVRDTTSKLTVDSINIDMDMKLNAQAEIPDIYCFDCEEWIGVSGVDLRGTPRSRNDAYYLDGMPTDVSHAKTGVIETLNELAEALLNRVDKLDNLDDAYTFIQTTLEQERSLSERVDSNGGEEDAQ